MRGQIIYTRSLGPAECSGWNCTEKTGAPSATRPSLDPSLALRNRGRKPRGQLEEEPLLVPLLVPLVVPLALEGTTS